MKITILTLFPEMFVGPFDHSIIKRAKEKGLVEVEYVNIRDFGEGPHKMVDDTAYGGGVGMVMKVDVLHKAIEHAKTSFTSMSSRQLQGGNNEQTTPEISHFVRNDKRKQKIILLSASGKTFKQESAKEFSKLDHLILICGHYEGVDERVKKFIDAEISIGDFVLTGGEIPAMLIADAVIRLIPDVLPKGATENESFSLGEEQKLLEYPHYTKPQIYEGDPVPEILLSGDHKKIDTWRHEQAIERTNKIRPDLLTKKVE
ncbi:MAG TPA: tRNA (guanosine(37)-N1)-methyltransferase TrmD [Methylomirabilota bacterium]|nr:tRNA (guanosine(37)-N1)-methyltransferase TrmD [Methylomirabilota bacterium]